MTPAIGEIRMFAGSFAPRSWAYCAGQLLSIAQNDALFSILGTNFGGDGRTTFGLPDLRGRAAISSGTGPGLTTYREGAMGGTQTVTLNQLYLAPHTHAVTGSVAVTINHKSINDAGGTGEPEGAVPAILEGVNAYAATSDGTMGEDSVISNANLNTTLAGGQQSFGVMPPFLTMNYIICLFGVYPSRS